MTHPIDEYLRAFKSYELKDKELAAENIAKSVGGNKATYPILSSLDKIFEEDTFLHKAVLDVVVSESKKREKSSKE